MGLPSQLLKTDLSRTIQLLATDQSSANSQCHNHWPVPTGIPSKILTLEQRMKRSLHLLRTAYKPIPPHSIEFKTRWMGIQLLEADLKPIRMWRPIDNRTIPLPRR